MLRTPATSDHLKASSRGYTANSPGGTGGAAERIATVSNSAGLRRCVRRHLVSLSVVSREPRESQQKAATLRDVAGSLSSLRAQGAVGTRRPVFSSWAVSGSSFQKAPVASVASSCTKTQEVEDFNSPLHRQGDLTAMMTSKRARLRVESARICIKQFVTDPRGDSCLDGGSSSSGTSGASSSTRLEALGGASHET